MSKEKQTKSAVDAQKRQAEGKALTVRDQAALRADDDRRREEQFNELAAAVPQKALCELLDTSRKIVLEWGRAGMPRNADRKKTYDLFVVLPWLRSRWNTLPADGVVLGDNEHDVEYKKYRARMMKANALEKEEELVPRARVREGLGRLAGLLRALGARLQRAYDPHAQEMLDETLDEYERVVVTEFSPKRRRIGATPVTALPPKKKAKPGRAKSTASCRSSRPCVAAATEKKSKKKRSKSKKKSKAKKRKTTPKKKAKKG